MTVAKPQIGIIVGSNSKTSINKQLAHGLVNLVQDQADFEACAPLLGAAAWVAVHQKK